MRDILVIGGGKIGSVVADLLAQTPEDESGYRVAVADRDPALLAEIDAGARHSPRLSPLPLDGTDAAALRAAMRGRYAVLSAAPYHLTVKVAEAARALG